MNRVLCIPKVYSSIILCVYILQEDALAELEKLHSELELIIMEHLHNVEKPIEKIEDGCQLADRVINHGNAIEVC